VGRLRVAPETVEFWQGRRSACTTGSATAGRRTVGSSSACRRKGMQLYLIRPRRRGQRGGNPARPLSARGLRQVAQLVAHFLHSGTLRPGEIWHSRSPARRNRRRAGGGPQSRDPAARTTGLEPEDDPRGIVERLAHATCDLAIVGHEPHLGTLAALLLHGPQPPAPFIFKKSRVLAPRGTIRPVARALAHIAELLKSPRRRPVNIPGASSGAFDPINSPCLLFLFRL